jgi:hypothetical protein
MNVNNTHATIRTGEGSISHSVLLIKPTGSIAASFPKV